MTSASPTAVSAHPQSPPTQANQEQLGYQAESGPWRGVYLQGAYELRNGVPNAGGTNTASPDTIRAMPPSMPDGIHLHSLVYRRVMRWAVGDRSAALIITGNGDVLEPENGIVAIGSGGAYAQAAAKALQFPSPNAVGFNNTQDGAFRVALIRRDPDIAGVAFQLPDTGEALVQSAGVLTAQAQLDEDQISQIRTADKGEVVIRVLIKDQLGVEPVEALFTWAWIPKVRK